MHIHTLLYRTALLLLLPSLSVTAWTQGSNSFGYPIAPDTTSSINAPVGSINGNMTVSSTGGATYTMAIEVPKGIADSEPSLSITYNSQLGNGLAGWGCNLTGFSVITRAPSDIFHDGKAGGKTYGTAGPFCLDGQRLLQWGEITNGDSIYFRPETDPFTDVWLHGLSGISGTSQHSLWFSVRTPDGVYHEYGHSNDSKQSYTINGVTKVNSWYITTETTPRRVQRQYSYASWNNSLYPQSISYGNNVVRFSYEQRPDTIRGAVEGLPVLVAKRLSSITTATVAGGVDSIYRRYELHYICNDQTTTSYSRLDRVTVGNRACETLRPTTLSWSVPTAYSCQKDTPSFEYSFNYLGTQRSSISLFAADFNGDGLADLAQYGRTQQPYASNLDFNYIQLHYGQIGSNGIFSFRHGETIDLGNNMSIGQDEDHLGWNSYRTSPVAFDIDADGKAELLVPEYYFSQDGSYFGFWAYKNGNNIGGVKYADLHTDKSEDILWTAGDFNNDGIAEFAVMEKKASGNAYYGVLMGGYQYPGYPHASYNKTFSFILPSKPMHIFSADMNCDGLTDIVVFYNQGYTVYYNNGTWLDDNLASPYAPSPTNYSLGLNPCKAWQGDFNGDGIPDFLVSAPDNHNFYFELGKGNGTFLQNVACTLDSICEQSQTGDDNDSFFCQVFDMDGDGKSDAVIHKAMYRESYYFYEPPYVHDKTYIYWMRSDGHRLVQQSVAYTSIDTEKNGRYYTVADFNGDGLAEVGAYSFDCYSDHDTGSDVSFRIYKNASFLPSSGKIVLSTDGLDRQTRVAYGVTTDATIRMDASGSIPSFPVVKVSAPLSVVASVSSDNGASGRNKQSYRYGTPLAHLQGRGLLGMRCSSVEDSITGRLSWSHVTEWHSSAFVPMVTRDTMTLQGHTAYGKKEYSVKNRVHGTANIFWHIPDRIENHDFDGNRTIENYDYTLDSNIPVLHSVDYNDGSYQSDVINEFVTKGGRSLPVYIDHWSRHGNNGNAIQTVTRFAYNDMGLVDTLVAYEETDKAITTTYTYDSYGNRLSKKMQGGSVSLTTDTWLYDASHRFATRHIENGLTKTCYTRDLWGNVLTETDSTRLAHPLTQTYTYDGWGRLRGTVSPIGLRTTYTDGWGHTQAQRRFKVTQGDGQPWIKTWYDSMGREVKTESIDSHGLLVTKTMSYNNKGLVSSEKNRQGNIVTTENHTYDYQGRVASSSLADSLGTLSLSVTYAYGSNWKSETRDGRTTKTICDSWGNPLSVMTPQDTVTYNYNSQGKPVSVTACGRTVTMEYDIMGNRTRLTDPDAGTMTYTYGGLGRIISQKNARNQTQNYTYDNYGRQKSEPKNGAVQVSYTYGTTTSNKGLLTCATNNYGGYKAYYDYDAYGRVTAKRCYVNGSYRNFAFTYNSLGQVATKSYPNGITVSYQYDAYGNHIGTMKGDTVIWQLESSTGNTTQWRMGTSFHQQTTVNAMGMPTAKSIRYGNTQLHSMTFAYNASTGNLTQRTGMLNVAENFTYDVLERLTGTTCGIGSENFTYAADGNITSKTGIGGYYYEGTRPHAVTSIDNDYSLVPDARQTVVYNAMGKVTSITEADGDTLTITYGPDGERWKGLFKEKGNRFTIIYLDDYEERIEFLDTESVCYLDGGVLAMHHADGTEQLYFAYTDHLGSVTRIYDENHQLKFKAAYNAWGSQTVYQNDIGFRRGYTGHEMLPEFGLINMNGRMYDPLLGRFLSTDDYVQSPFDSQSFNRYSYCLNNPLKYIDPDGEIWWIPILANICMSAAISYAHGDGLLNGALQGLAYSAVSLAGSYATNLISGAIGHQIGNIGTELLRAGAHGLIQGSVNALTGGDFLNGFASGGLSSLIGSGLGVIGGSSDISHLGMGATGAIVSQLTDGNFIDGFMTGLNICSLNHKWEILPDGTPHCLMDEIVVIGIDKSRIASLSYIAAMSGAKSMGSLIAYNRNNKVIFNTQAVSGSLSKYRTLPPGEYDITKYENSTDPVFTRKDVGFKVIIYPDPFDSYLQRSRTLLRIHPARGSSTMGCIGLISNDSDSLRMFKRMFSSSLKNNNPIPLNVIINGY